MEHENRGPETGSLRGQGAEGPALTLYLLRNRFVEQDAAM